MGSGRTPKPRRTAASSSANGPWREGAHNPMPSLDAGARGERVGASPGRPQLGDAVVQVHSSHSSHSSPGKQLSRRGGSILNSATFLILLSAMSYLTTFVRERFFYQRAYGTSALDHLELTVSALAVISNVGGMVLAFMWVSGRLRPRVTSVGVLAGCGICAATASMSLTVAACVGIALCSTGFLVANQRAADTGRQAFAIVGAVSAVIPTLSVWEVAGTRQSQAVLAGYLAGAAWQAAFAIAAGFRSHRPQAARAASLLWPLTYMAALQLDGLVDQLLLLNASPGWLGAAALARNIVTAAAVVLVGPLSSQAMAGRFNLGRGSRLIAIALATTALTLVVLPVVLPLAIKGGAVNGLGYHRMLTLSLLYALAIPFSTYWQVHTRAAHVDATRWRSMAHLALCILAVHLIVIAPIVLFRQWELMPLGTVAAYGAGTLMLVRRQAGFRAPP